MQTYKIGHIRDLLKVPAERREICVREILYGLLLTELADGGTGDVDLQAIDWTDDDERHVTLNANGEDIARLEIDRPTTPPHPLKE